MTEPQHDGATQPVDTGLNANVDEIQDVHDEETCRICSGPAEPDQPLYHPCKCSGTIRYVHQDCLKGWLNTSKRTKCDLCKHTYQFTKVYAPDMPSSIPLDVVGSRVIAQIGHWSIFSLRLGLVALVWLITLPAMLAWSWKASFWFGDYSAWSVFGDAIAPLNESLLQATFEISNHSRTLTEYFESLLGHDTQGEHFKGNLLISLDHFRHDIFFGQMIAFAIVVTFVCIFFLKEWVVQNARPGMFEDPQPPPVPVEGEGEAPEALNDIQVDLRVVDAPEEDNIVAFYEQEELLGAFLSARNQPPTSLDEALRSSEDFTTTVALPVKNLQETDPTLNLVSPIIIPPFRPAMLAPVVRPPLAGSSATGDPSSSHNGNGDTKKINRKRALPPSDFFSNPDQIHPSLRPTPGRLKPIVHSTANPGDISPTTTAVYERLKIRGLQESSHFESELPFPLNNQSDGSKSVSELAPLNGPQAWLQTAESAFLSGPSRNRYKEDNELTNGFQPRPSTSKAVEQSFIPEDLDQQQSSVSSSWFNMTPVESMATSQTIKVVDEETAPNEEGSHRENPIVVQPNLEQTELNDDFDKGPGTQSLIAPSFASLPTTAVPDLPGVAHSEVFEPEFEPPETISSLLSEKDENLQSTDDQVLPLPQEVSPLASSSVTTSTQSPPPLAGRRQAPGMIDLPPRPTGFPRRPGLPSSAGAGEIQVLASGSTTSSPSVNNPLNSPSYAYYAPPEELLTRSTEDLKQVLDERVEPVGGGERSDDQILVKQEYDAYFAPVPPPPKLISAISDETIKQEVVDNLENFDAGGTSEGVWTAQDDLKPKEDFNVDNDVEIKSEEQPKEILLPAVEHLLVEGPQPEAEPEADAEVEQEPEADAGEQAVWAGQDDEPFGEDDMGHAMEAVGMRGPLRTLFQNAALVLLVLDIAIVGAVVSPFIIGKNLALLIINLSTLNSNHLPKASIPGEPSGPSVLLPIPIFLLDGVFKLIRGMILAPIIAWEGVKYLFNYQDVLKTASHVNRWSDSYDRVAGFVISPIGILTSKLAVNGNFAAFIAKPVGNAVQLLLKPALKLGNLSMKHSESFRNLVLFTTGALTQARPWKDGSSVKALHILPLLDAYAAKILQAVAHDRAHAVLFGWTMFLIALFLHFHATGMKAAALSLKLFKVSVLLIIESGLKPLLIGVLLNIFTLSLFPNASVESRLLYWKSAPFSNVFQHWLLGNMILMCIVYLMDDTRRLLRPMIVQHIQLYFDPVGRSIQEMINKPLVWHLKKFVSTGFSTLLIAWIFVGCTVDLILAWTSNFGPLRWNLNEPISDVPVDLILLHVFLPATFTLLRIRRTARHTFRSFLHDLGKVLRLSNFLFHKPAEEEFLEWVPILQSSKEMVDGKFYRVPASQQTRLLEGRDNAVEVDKDGHGLTPRNKLLIEIQDSAAKKAERDPKTDWQTVFYPNYFYLRVAFFLIASFVGFVAAVWISAVLPIQIGRLIFRKVLNSNNVHDVYSWLAGLYCCWFAQFWRSFLGREHRRWARYIATKKRKRIPIKLFVYHTTRVLMRPILGGFALFLLLPLLLGGFFEVYLVLPIKYTLARHGGPGNFRLTGGDYVGEGVEATPIVRIVDVWVEGLFWGVLLSQAQAYAPPNVFSRLLDSYRREGWYKVKVTELYRDFVGPMALGLASLIILPFVIQMAISPWTNNNRFVLLEAYPMIISVFFTAVALSMTGNAFESWTQALRDKEYLLETRIRNIEEGPAANEQVETAPVAQ